jgi:hypothetical protein
MADRTLGWLNVYDGPIRLFRCACLELPWKDNEPKISCVPAGTYPLHKEYSSAFKDHLWELKLVPGRSECKIHSANYPSQLLGCIAPGLIHADLDRDGRLDAAKSKQARLAFHAAMGEETVSEIHIVGDGRDVLKEGMSGYK